MQNLVAVSRLRRAAQKAGLSDVIVMGPNLRIAPANLPDSMQVRLQRMYPGSRYLAQASAITVPLPPSPSDADLIAWVTNLLSAVFGADVIAAGESSTAD